MERLADVEHERWSHWQRYLHSKCERVGDGSLVIPAHLVERWESQMNTPYSALSEKEKESDREQVRRYLPIIADALKPRLRLPAVPAALGMYERRPLTSRAAAGGPQAVQGRRRWPVRVRCRRGSRRV